MMRVILLVALLGAGGAVSRYLVAEMVQRTWDIHFPLGTLIVNVLGCFLLGALAQAGLEMSWIPKTWQLALETGFLGGMTTFSTFGHETFRHLERGDLSAAAGNIAASLVLGLLAVWGGITLVRWWVA